MPHAIIVLTNSHGEPQHWVRRGEDEGDYYLACAPRQADYPGPDHYRLVNSATAELACPICSMRLANYLDWRRRNYER